MGAVSTSACASDQSLQAGKIKLCCRQELLCFTFKRASKSLYEIFGKRFLGNDLRKQARKANSAAPRKAVSLESSLRPSRPLRDVRRSFGHPQKPIRR